METKGDSVDELIEKTLALKVDVSTPTEHPVSLTSGASSSISSAMDSPFSMDYELKAWLDDLLASPNYRSTSKLHVKMLMSNAASGSIIGKGGVNITRTQAQTHAKVQLSKSFEFFPGTRERTLLVAGTLRQIMSALCVIYIRLIREDAAPVTTMSTDPSPESSPKEGNKEIDRSKSEESVTGQPSSPYRIFLSAKMLVPRELCGIIVGKNGSVIQHCAKVSNAQVRVTQSKAVGVNLTHNVVGIQGELRSILKAIAMLILRQAEDPNFQNYAVIPESYVASGMPSHMEGAHYMSPTSMSMPFGAPVQQHPMLPFAGGTMVSVVVPLADAQRRVLLHNNQAILREIEGVARVEARIETDITQGTFMLRLSGHFEAVSFAYGTLSLKLLQFSGSQAS